MQNPLTALADDVATTRRALDLARRPRATSGSLLGWCSSYRGMDEDLGPDVPAAERRTLPPPLPANP